MLMWELESELLGKKDAAYWKIAHEECKTLKDFLDLEFNGVFIKGEDGCYWKAGDNNYDGTTCDVMNGLSEELLNTPVVFSGYDTDDEYETIWVERKKDEEEEEPRVDYYVSITSVEHEKDGSVTEDVIESACVREECIDDIRRIVEENNYDPDEEETD